MLVLNAFAVLLQYYFSEFLHESDYISKMDLGNYFIAMIINTFLINYMRTLFFYYFSLEFSMLKNNMLMLIAQKMLDCKILNKEDL